MAGLWFSPGTPISSINKTDSYNVTEILLTKQGSTVFSIIDIYIYIGSSAFRKQMYQFFSFFSLCLVIELTNNNKNLSLTIQIKN